MKKRLWASANILAWFAIGAMAVSCGKKDETNSVSSKTTEESTVETTSVSIELEGSILGTTDPEAFRTYIREGRFAKQGFDEGSYVKAKYLVTSFICENQVKEKDFLGIDYTYIDSDCDEQPDLYRRETKNSNAVTNEYGSTKEEMLTFLDRIASGTFVKVLPNTEDKAAVFYYDSKYFTVDFRLPIALNPAEVKKYNEDGELESIKAFHGLFYGQVDIQNKYTYGVDFTF